MSPSSWYDTDNDARSPLEADLDDIRPPVKQIKVQYIPSEYRATLFWYDAVHSGVKGIAGWQAI